jgi:hypothetical protein
MSFESIEEKIFKDRVHVDTSGMVYVEYGKDFVRFRHSETGRLFEVKVRERKTKK